MHAYEILFSPTGGTAKVAAALTTDWSSVKTIDLSIPSTHYEDICLESDSLAVIAMPAFEVPRHSLHSIVSPVSMETELSA